MRAALLIPIVLAAAGCGTRSAEPSAQQQAAGLALPPAGASDAVRTARPGTAPVPGATPTPSASVTP